MHMVFLSTTGYDEVRVLAAGVEANQKVLSTPTGSKIEER
jgi:hypothetical protein